MTIIELEPLQVKIKDAARLLGFDQRTIRRLIERRELEATGHGQNRRVIMASLRAYVERNRVE